nr:Toll/interleukin-1 receptor (TIR) domain-containing protein [Tanacetum cinerariifolium]
TFFGTQKFEKITFHKIASFNICHLTEPKGPEKLPDDLARIESLEKLIITNCNRLRDIPKKMGKLKCVMSRKDPFGIYEIFNMSKVDVNPESSIPYPPGFTPEKGNKTTMFANISHEVQEEHHKSASCSSRVFEEVENFDIYVQSEGKGGRPVRKEGGSILDALDDMIKVGQAMGFTMDGCTNDMEKIIGSNREHEGS